jgi:hypothetical protein
MKWGTVEDAALRKIAAAGRWALVCDCGLCDDVIACFLIFAVSTAATANNSDRRGVAVIPQGWLHKRKKRHPSRNCVPQLRFVVVVLVFDLLAVSSRTASLSFFVFFFVCFVPSSPLGLCMSVKRWELPIVEASFGRSKRASNFNFSPLFPINFHKPLLSFFLCST